MPRVSYSRFNYISTENKPSVGREQYCRIFGMATLLLALLLSFPMGSLQSQDPGLTLEAPTVSLSMDEVDAVLKSSTQDSSPVIVPVRIAGARQANFVQLSVDYDLSLIHI